MKHYFLVSFDILRKTEIEEKHILGALQAIITGFNNLFMDLERAIDQQFRKEHLSELRVYTFSLTKLFVAVELMKFYLSTNKVSDFEVVKRWIDRGIYNKEGYSNKMDEELCSSMSHQHYLGENKSINGTYRSRL